MAQLYNALLAFLSLYISLVQAVQPLIVEGSDFVNSVTKDRFQIIGVAYQPGGSSGFNPGSGIDPLSNGTICLRDAALMQRLGVNTIRVYNLDPDINHDECASIFNAVGIYMILDVNSPLPNQSLNRGDPASSYNSDYLSRIFGVVEAFKNFPNTLGFFGGNEVINEDSTEEVPSYIRAVTRDLHNYISKHSTRPIPVGYSAADVRPLLQDTFSYLSCTTASDPTTEIDASRIEFFGLNSYSWCGAQATFTSSGYDVLVAMFSNTTIPVFFSEYGCNKVLPRTFTEVQALYGKQMTGVMSGGLVYEYSQEVSNFGLVILNDNGTTSIRTDYDNLQDQYEKLDIASLESANATATSLTPPTCDASLITGTFPTSFSIPDIPDGGQDLIDNGIKNPNNGKLVAISNDDVTSIVYNSKGQELKGLVIKPLPNDQSNTPGENDSGTTGTSSGATGTNSGATPSATKKGAASLDRSVQVWVVAAVAAVGAVCLL